ncbi:MAG TPA: DUF998 domain-containing protein [Acidimicrobiia bacterium]
MAIEPASRPDPLRRLGVLCMLCPVWFLIMYAVFSSLNPGFSHLNEPISGLGAIGEPRAPAWNVLSFIAPGALVVALGSAIRRSRPDAPISNLAGSSVIISGILLAAAGIFPTNTTGDPTILYRVHEMSGWGSFAAFLVAGISTPWVVWAWTRSKSLFVIPIALVIGTAISYGLLLPDLWWLRQRIGVMCYFLWVGVMGLVILRQSDRTSRTNRVGTAGESLVRERAESLAL